MQLRVYRICSIFAYRMMTSKISIQHGIRLFLGKSEMPPENVLEGLYKNKLQGSEQLQTSFAMYNQELSRDRVTPSCQRLRKMVKQHIDQMTRTRKCKARNQRLEAGVMVSSQQREKCQRGERKWENAFNGRRTDSVQEEIAQSSSSTSGVPTQTDGRRPYGFSLSTRSESFWIERQKTVSELAER